MYFNPLRAYIKFVILSIAKAIDNNLIGALDKKRTFIVMHSKLLITNLSNSFWIIEELTTGF